MVRRQVLTIFLLLTTASMDVVTSDTIHRYGKILAKVADNDNSPSEIESESLITFEEALLPTEVLLEEKEKWEEEKEKEMLDTENDESIYLMGDMATELEEKVYVLDPSSSMPSLSIYPVALSRPSWSTLTMVEPRFVRQLPPKPRRTLSLPQVVLADAMAVKSLPPITSKHVSTKKVRGKSVYTPVFYSNHPFAPRRESKSNKPWREYYEGEWRPSFNPWTIAGFRPRRDAIHINYREG